MPHSDGIATKTIDTFYAAKLVICKEWDHFFGVTEWHPFSAVGTLNFFYTIRRPGFQLCDRAMRVMLEG